MKNKNILAIEISTELCSVAIKYKNKIFTKYKFNKKINNKYILVLIDSIIKKNKINIKKINYFVINTGPGSIIGTKLSLNIAQIFILRYKKIKILKINTFHIINENIRKIKKINKKKIYIVIYNSKINIKIYNNKKNIFIKKKYILSKKFKKKNNEKNKIYLITNQYKSKNKIINIFKNKNIKVIYPKAKYMISYIYKKLIKN